jgi:hypothetical protein
MHRAPSIPRGWKNIAVGRIHPTAARPHHRIRPTDSRKREYAPGKGARNAPPPQPCGAVEYEYEYEYEYE